MGGCRCVFRNCQNSTAVSTGLHYFHFPVRDPVRCKKWIENARKPEFLALEKNKLCNKVVCSMHFEEKCFSNERHERLIHSAVPTISFDDETEETPKNESKDDIMLIPMDAENTKFSISNEEFPGVSYTIFDDAVIPTSKIEEVLVEDVKSGQKPKEFKIKSIIKKVHPATKKISQKTKDAGQFVLKKIENSQHIRTEVITIPPYSVSTCNGDVSLAPSSNLLPDIIIEKIEQKNNQEEQKHGDITLQHKNQNEYTLSVTPVCSNEEEFNQNEETVAMTEENQSKELEKNYVQMIKNNTKQIKQLKRLVHKQSKMNRLLWQHKQAQVPRLRQRKLNKLDLIDSLKYYVKPSLSAILKLELLPLEEVVLTDQEEKFIMDLYTENPECYDLLRTKFKWNLPTSERIEDPNEIEIINE